jgi:hypothetical protein
MALVVDVNDPEVIESLSFLAVSKEERIENSTKPFDSKKDIFVKDAKEGYLAAKIESEDGANVTVKKVNGEVCFKKK